MKFNQQLQAEVTKTLARELLNDPGLLVEYDNMSSFRDKGDLWQVVAAGFELGLDLTLLEAFQLWSTLSVLWRCSGWMYVGEDKPKWRIANMLKEALGYYGIQA